jgi:hypothetical protein
MPKLTVEKLPKYRHHKASGQALVELSGKPFYLGRYGTPASRREYDRLVTEWLANGRQLPMAAADLTVVVAWSKFNSSPVGRPFLR